MNMQQPIRLIVTDLDGTFLNGYHDLNEANIRAVKRAREHGIAVCPVTARNFDCARYSIISAGFDALCVTNNGASIVDSRDVSHKYANFIDAPSVRAIIEASVKAKASVDVFATEFAAIYGPTRREASVMHQRRWEEKPAHLRPHFEYYDDVDDMVERVQDCAENITLHGENLEELPGWLYRRIVEQGEFYLTSSHHMCIDIMAYGSTKWQGVARLADMMGVARENVMAFGDNSNDIGMIRWAGVGVAMGNAPESVRRTADVVAKNNTDDGFAELVNALVDRQGTL
jgi:Cof subfamily protein (haloacid dehalogenase superfamily)